MRLTGTRTIWLGVPAAIRRGRVPLILLAVLLAALGIDRFVLTPGHVKPSTAIATPAVPSGTRPVIASPQSGDVPQPAEPDAPKPLGPRRDEGRPGATCLAARLESLAAERELDVAGVKDAFAPSSEWVGPGPDSAEAAQGGPAWRFAKEHRLRSVLVSDDAGSVTVNNTVVALNEEIDGFKLVSVTDRTAVFQCGDESVELKLESAASP